MNSPRETQRERAIASFFSQPLEWQKTHLAAMLTLMGPYYEEQVLAELQKSPVGGWGPQPPDRPEAVDRVVGDSVSPHGSSHGMGDTHAPSGEAARIGPQDEAGQGTAALAVVGAPASTPPGGGAAAALGNNADFALRHVLSRPVVRRGKGGRTDIPPGYLMTLDEAAGRLGISRRTLEREISHGRFPRPLKVGRSCRVTHADYDFYMTILKQKAARKPFMGSHFAGPDHRDDEMLRLITRVAGLPDR